MKFLPAIYRYSNLRPKGVDTVEGWLSPEVCELLFDLASGLTGRGCIVEIGAWKGKSTICLASGSLHGPTVPVYSIDPHTGSQEHHHLAQTKDIDTFNEFQSNIRAYSLENTVTPLRMTSQEAFPNLNHPIELLWIDGSHEYPDVHFDFVNGSEKLVPGGWVAFHDSKWPGVKKVLWEELFPHPCFGPILRVEDTTFAQKLSGPSQISQSWNRFHLLKAKAGHEVKRKRRKLRKRVRSWVDTPLFSRER